MSKSLLIESPDKTHSIDGKRSVKMEKMGNGNVFLVNDNVDIGNDNDVIGDDPDSVAAEICKALGSQFRRKMPNEMSDSSNSFGNSPGSGSTKSLLDSFSKSNNTNTTNSRELPFGSASENAIVVDTLSPEPRRAPAGNRDYLHQGLLELSGMDTKVQPLLANDREAKRTQQDNLSSTGDKDDTSDPAQNVQSKPTHKYTVLSILYIVALCSVGFTSNVFVSMVAPILPDNFKSLGVRVVWVGLVFSMFSVAILLFSPLCKRLSEQFGRAAVLTFGLLIQGICGIIFGYSIYMTDYVGPTGILWIMLVMRTVQGAGAAGCNLAVFAMVADHFKENLGSVMGLNEVMIGMGFSFGPPIGAILEVYGGFHFPFLVAGLAIMLTVPISVAIGYLERQELQANDKERQKKLEKNHSADIENQKEGQSIIKQGETKRETKTGHITYTSLLTAKSFLIPSIFLFLGTTIFGITEPIYTIHCENFLGYNQLGSGYMLALLSCVYSCAGIPTGAYADRKKNHVTVIFYGAIVSGISLLGLGVRPESMSTDMKLISEIGLLILLGLGQAGILIPTLPAMQTGVKEIQKSGNVEEEENTKDTEIVVALFNIFQQGGLIFGPILGAVMNEQFGFEIAMIVGSGITLGYCTLVGMIWKFSPQTIEIV